MLKNDIGFDYRVNVGIFLDKIMFSELQRAKIEKAIAQKLKGDPEFLLRRETRVLEQHRDVVATEKGPRAARFQREESDCRRRLLRGEAKAAIDERREIGAETDRLADAQHAAQVAGGRRRKAARDGASELDDLGPRKLAGLLEGR